MAQVEDKDYDIIIVGAGLVGATLALQLGQIGAWRIALIDKGEAPTWTDEHYSLRINAYNLASQALLKSLGIWEKLPADRVYPFRHMAVNAGNETQALSLDAADIPADCLGYFAENDLVLMQVMQAVMGCDAVDTLLNTQVTDISDLYGEKVQVQTDDKCLTAKLLVAADGGQSPLRDKAGIAVRKWDYHQRCVVGHLSFEGDLQQTAWQRFLPTGPLGLLPLAKGSCSLAWSLDSAEAERVLALSDEDFVQRLNQYVPARCSQFTAIGKRASFPLCAKQVKKYSAGRLVLVGDAAHSIHPLAGLGANLGLKDVAYLARLLMLDRYDLQELQGVTALLQAYTRKRRLPERSCYARDDSF